VPKSFGTKSFTTDIKPPFLNVKGINRNKLKKEREIERANFG